VTALHSASQLETPHAACAIYSIIWHIFYMTLPCPTFINFKWYKTLWLIITRSPRSVPTSQLLSNLHWLPIHKRINFKVATVTYKVLSTQQRAYLYKLISYHHPIRSLRSSSQSLLQVPRVKTDFGRRAFSSAAPQIWNHIPAAIKVSPSLDSFKRHLKTHYFTSP